MIFTKQSWELAPQDFSGDLWKGMEKQIELVAKNCYGAQHNITDSSYAKFVEGLVNSKHYAPLEFGEVYLCLSQIRGSSHSQSSLANFFDKSAYSKITNQEFISTNYRVLVENGLTELLDYAVVPTEYHLRQRTVKLITNRQIMAEITRHRSASFCIESSRYCNYTKSKFGSSLTFITPEWCNHDFTEITGTYAAKKRQILEFYESHPDEKKTYLWLMGALEDEDYYFGMIEEGFPVEYAAQGISNRVKTSIYVSAYAGVQGEGWNHIFDLRSSTALTGKPHSQMVELMDPIKECFAKL